PCCAPACVRDPATHAAPTSRLLLGRAVNGSRSGRLPASEFGPGRQTGLNGATPPREKPHLFGLRLGFDSSPRHLGLSRVYTECGDALPASVLIGCSQTVVRLPEPPHPAGATSSENAVEIALFGGEGGVGGDAS